MGIGDLLMVREHVLRYEGGDLAHVENVLKSETLSRDTRRLERTETTILQETETTKEQTCDTQTTDRFSLKRETSDTIKSDSSFKAGVSVDAKYGPFVEVKANADFATSSSSESLAKQASEFSKDVVDRSVSKVVERVLSGARQRRSRSSRRNIYTASPTSAPVPNISAACTNGSTRLCARRSIITESACCSTSPCPSPRPNIS